MPSGAVAPKEMFLQPEALSEPRLGGVKTEYNAKPLFYWMQN